MEALWQAKQEEQQASLQVQATLQRTTSIASELEIRLGEQSAVQEESRATVLRAEDMSSQALRETRQLQALQQSTTEELHQSVMDIDIKIQKQAQKTLFQDQTSKEAQEKMT